MSTLIIDGHLDLAFNGLFNRRDQRQPAMVLREREDVLLRGPSADPEAVLVKENAWKAKEHGVPTVSLPDMRRGHVGIGLITIMSRIQLPRPDSHNSVRTQAVAHAQGISHLAYYEALEREGEVRFIKSAEDLDASVAEWEHPTPETPIGLILTMEGADPILGPDNAQDWWEAGLRSVSLTHFGGNTYGHGTGTEGGLYPPAYPLFGRAA